MHRLVIILGALLLALPSSTVWAGYFSIIHNQTNTNASTGSAIVLAAPATDNGKITVTRIRLTSSKSTSLDFRFRAAREQLSLGDTKAMAGWSCTGSSDGCFDIYSIEGVKAGELYDMVDLQLTMDSGQRCFVYSDATIGTDYFTIEVWWRER